jgi:hypothetical protein
MLTVRDILRARGGFMAILFQCINGDCRLFQEATTSRRCQQCGDKTGYRGEPDPRYRSSPGGSSVPDPVARVGQRQVISASTVHRKNASRYVDAACYAITGLFVLIAGSKGSHAVISVPVGLITIGYGIRIGLTNCSYWVSTVTYIIPILGLLWLLFA